MLTQPHTHTLILYRSHQPSLRHNITWKWKMTSKQSPYELNNPCLGSLICFVLAHSLTYRQNLDHDKDHVPVTNTNFSAKQTNKIISRNRSSIWEIHKRHFDFTWPRGLLIEISHDILVYLLSKTSRGTLAFGINFSIQFDLWAPPEM